jgi:hypothetical protein
MNRREFLRPFGDRRLMPKFPASPIAWLGYFNAALAGGLASSCAKPLPTSPTVSDATQPLAEVLASNGTRAVLKHHGYANADKKPLLDAMRDSGLNPKRIESGFMAGTWQVGNSSFGWIFYIRQQFFGEDPGNVLLNDKDLWAVYEKQSIG